MEFSTNFSKEYLAKENFNKTESVVEQILKILDEKIKFDPLLDKFSQVLDYFGVKDSFMASQYAPILYTPENMSIISALAKVLEAEGFTNESVTKMAKAYDDNIKKLIENTHSKYILLSYSSGGRATENEAVT
jgi:adenine-specific DNA methylase